MASIIVMPLVTSQLSLYKYDSLQHIYSLQPGVPVSSMHLLMAELQPSPKVGIKIRRLLC